MNKKSYINTVNDVLDYILSTYKKSIFLGEDIGIYGGAFGASKGLLQKHGKNKVLDTPISESSIVGFASGLALNGYKTIVEIMFADFLTLTMDQIINNISKIKFLNNVNIDLVIRTPFGGHRGYGLNHSQSFESILISIPKINIIAPSNSYDLKGLFLKAINSGTPTILLEHKMLYSKKHIVPEEYYEINIGKGKIINNGNLITIVSYSYYINILEELLKQYPEYEKYLEIIDLRSIKPLDINLIASSLKKTGNLMIIEESNTFGGIGAEISAQITENYFYYLDSPITRIGNNDSLIPCSIEEEKKVLPTAIKIKNEIDRIINSYVKRN